MANHSRPKLSVFDSAFVRIYKCYRNACNKYPLNNIILMSDIKSLHFKTKLANLFQVGFRFVTFAISELFGTSII